MNFVANDVYSTSVPFDGVVPFKIVLMMWSPRYTTNDGQGDCFQKEIRTVLRNCAIFHCFAIGSMMRGSYLSDVVSKVYYE